MKYAIPVALVLAAAGAFVFLHRPHAPASQHDVTSNPVAPAWERAQARVKERAHQLATGRVSGEMQQSIDRGRALFTKVFTPEEGLGPYYNERSCADCHAIPGLLGRGSVEKAGVAYGPGRSITGEYESARFLPRHTLPGFPDFKMPDGFKYLGRRVAPPLQGLGWIEAVEASQILARPHCTEPKPPPGEVCGWAPAKPQMGYGTLRFGRKLVTATLEEFVESAFEMEMGLTSPDAEKDLDGVRDPEISEQQIADLANYIAFSPPPGQPLPPSEEPALASFKAIGCADCHFSRFQVEGKPTPQLYSDLLAHDLGPALAEGAQDERTPAGHFRTAPLWGLRMNPGPYLHDGRATTLEAAILLHGGEAAKARAGYQALDGAGRDRVIHLLQSL